MKQQQLNKQNIFSIDVGDYFDQPQESLQLVYSPFTEKTFISTPDFVEKMEAVLAHPEKIDDEIQPIVKDLVAEYPPAHYLEPGILENGFNTLLILPNNICNFSCSYCYSAQGRSGKKLTKAQITGALEDFISPKFIKEDKCFISLLGGGEPLMTWDLTKHIIEYGTQLAEKQGYYIWFSLVTNGSILNDEILNTFKNHNIRIAVSFEILEEIQNLQRGSYNIVDQNLKRLLQENIPTRIRSTITKDNVLLQEQMVQRVIDEYPDIKNIVLEEVTDTDYFETPDKLRAFYHDFLENFNKARDLGLKHQKHVECSSFRNNNLFIDRFCPGVLCITPEGTLSTCSRISSPNDSGYPESLFGDLNNNQLNIDQKQLEKLIIDHNVENSREACATCFTKWHCGGGCYAHKFIYPEEMIDVVCEYKREYTKRKLLSDLDAEYRQEQGLTLKEFILKQLNIS